MKHYPAKRSPVQLSGLSYSRAPWYASPKTVALLVVVAFTAGLFLGAAAFGEVLVRSIPVEAVRK